VEVVVVFELPQGGGGIAGDEITQEEIYGILFQPVCERVGVVPSDGSEEFLRRAKKVRKRIEWNNIMLVK